MRSKVFDDLQHRHRPFSDGLLSVPESRGLSVGLPIHRHVGGAVLVRYRGIVGRMFGVARSDPPDPWYPYVFTAPQDAIAAGLPSSDTSTPSITHE